MKVNKLKHPSIFYIYMAGTYNLKSGNLFLNPVKMAIPSLWFPQL